MDTMGRHRQSCRRRRYCCPSACGASSEGRVTRLVLGPPTRAEAEQLVGPGAEAL